MNNNIDKIVNIMLKNYDNLNKEIANARLNNKPEDKSIFVYSQDWKRIEQHSNKGTIYNVFMQQQPLIKKEFNALILSIIATWRYTKTIYNFNHEIQEQLSKSEFKGDLPIELFERLPEYSICIKLAYPIKLPLLTYMKDIDYIFVSINKEENSKYMIITTYSIKECIWGCIWLELKKEIKLCHYDSIYNQVRKLYSQEAIECSTQNFEKSIREILPYILYIISDKPDIYDINNKEHKTTNVKEIYKKGELRLFPVDKVTEWNVGDNFKDKIKKYYSSVNNEYTISPHIRRGHWHTYWTGSKTGQQKPVLNWIFPILVNENKICKE